MWWRKLYASHCYFFMSPEPNNDENDNNKNITHSKNGKLISRFTFAFSMIVIITVAGFTFDWMDVVKGEKDISEKNLEQTEIESKKNTSPDMTEYTIEPGDTFDSIMEKFGVNQADRLLVFEVAKEIHDFSELRSGQVIRLNVQDGIGLTRLEYEYGDEDILVIERGDEGFTAINVPIEYEVKIATANGEIKSSLFGAAAEQNVPDGVIMEITDILAWQVDFVSDVRVGDSFKIVYEKRYRDGEYVDYGRVLGVVFTNQNEDSWAIFYENEDGEKGYYDLEGNSVKKAFLKSPLQYKYISSGYTNSRLHPVLKKYLPHRAIDYAARAGTPIAAVGNGRVTYAGRKGGDGIFIEIKHNNTYITRYSHMQSIAKGIKVGTKVKQNDIIGYVGSTGYSTGPHLQYAMLKNNTPVNPLEIDLPSGDPIPEIYMNDFLSVVEKIKRQLNE